MDLKRIIYLFFSEKENLDILKNLRKKGMTIGNNSIFRTTFYGDYPFLISIGENCYISDNVYFFNKDEISNWVIKDTLPSHANYGTICIGNNCYIGDYAILLPGTKIGDNSIIEPGAILQGDFENGSTLSGILINSSNVYQNI